MQCSIQSTSLGVIRVAPARYITPEIIEKMQVNHSVQFNKFLAAPRKIQDQEYERHHILGTALWRAMSREEQDEVRECYYWKMQMKQLVEVDIGKE